MTLKELLAQLYQQPQQLMFAEVLEVIEAEFEFTPAAFSNGNVINKADENQGSCKVLSFAHKAGLNEANTLLLFAEHYRQVQADPEGTDHQNIRQFMSNGWQGVSFETVALKKRL